MDATSKNDKTNEAPDSVTQGLSALGKGIGNLLRGISKAGGGALAADTGKERSFVLRYNAESKTVKESDLKPGTTLPTVHEAFTQHAAALGLEAGRDRTYRVGETVADAAERVEFGNTYTAAVTRSTKG